MFESVAFPTAAAPPARDPRPPTGAGAAEAKPTPFKDVLASTEAPAEPEAERESVEPTEPTETPEPAVPADDPATLAALALLLQAQAPAPAPASEAITAAPETDTSRVTGPAAAPLPTAVMMEPLLDATPAAEAAPVPAGTTAANPTSPEWAALLQEAATRADVATLSPEALTGAAAPVSPEAPPVKTAKAAAAVTTAEPQIPSLLGSAAAAPPMPKIEPARLAEAQLPTIALSPEVVLPQIVRGVDSMARSGATSMHLQLHPEALGRIDVRVTSGADGMRVTLTADQAATGSLLQHNLADLRHTLTETGLSIAGLSVGVGQGQTGQGFGWQPPTPPPAKPGPASRGDDLPLAEPVTGLALAGAGSRVDYRI